QEHVAPSETYRYKPGGPNDFVHIYVSRAPGSTQFASLCKVIGHEEFIDDPRMQTPQDRYLVKDILNKAIEEWTMQHEKHEAMDILATNDIPAGALLDIEDFANEKHYMDEGIIIEVDHYQYGKLKMPGFAPRMSENHIEYEPSPKLGEHTDEIYSELLGMSEDKLKELRDKNII
nr:CoA transferase [Lachnospiraceae bacterium]